MAAAVKAKEETEKKAGDALDEAARQKKDADRKLAIANRLMADYQAALTRETAKVKREIQKKSWEEFARILGRKSRQLSDVMFVLLAAYLVQLVAILIIEKDTSATIPSWFRDRYGNILWLSQRLGEFYQSSYRKMETAMPSLAAIGILIFVSASSVVILFFLIRFGFYCIMQEWKKRWEFYERGGVEPLKKTVAASIAFMGFSLSMVAVNLPFIPLKLNVVSWWILITGVMEFMYFHYDTHGF